MYSEHNEYLVTKLDRYNVDGQRVNTSCNQKKRIKSRENKQGLQYRIKGNNRIHSNNRYGNFTKLRKTLQATTRYIADPFGTVINLSNNEFLMHEFKLLGYNLNFIPAPGYLNLNHFNQDITQFGRKIKLRAHFGPNNKTNNTEIMFHKGNITWEPSQVHHTIYTF